ncbi:hypothetical protein [Nocardioides sp.]|uniref:hypothetical protein n=1 Tax=Nocardioides sp. TaxID=35761 RepID=UPI0027339DFB|nr:hypothetical protein [Nocardioides sp.]MDP3892798.1 hypothetical protein [Nocardioides sp.]
MVGEISWGVRLRRGADRSAEVAALGRLLGGPAGIDAVLDDLDRVALRRRVLARAASWSCAWDDTDQHTAHWWPQGVTTSADATDTEDVAGRRVVAVSWYAKRRDDLHEGCRVSFLDLDAMRYRHVLVVVPGLDADGALTLRPLRVHAGGIVWHGAHLHVAATAKGFHTCRIDDLMRVPDHLFRADPDGFGITDHAVATHGYRYVLPVRVTHIGDADEGLEPMRYSFLSLDRSADPPELVAGEYGRGAQTTRLLRYPLDPESGLPATDLEGVAHPLLLDPGGVPGMQGAAVARGRWYVTTSHGPRRPGSVYVGAPGRLRRHRAATPVGPEDVSYWPSTDTLWSATEHPGRRYVFAMERAWFHRPWFRRLLPPGWVRRLR